VSEEIISISPLELEAQLLAQGTAPELAASMKTFMREVASSARQQGYVACQEALADRIAKLEQPRTCSGCKRVSTLESTGLSHCKRWDHMVVLDEDSCNRWEAASDD